MNKVISCHSEIWIFSLYDYFDRGGGGRNVDNITFCDSEIQQLLVNINTKSLYLKSLGIDWGLNNMSEVYTCHHQKGMEGVNQFRGRGNVFSYGQPLGNELLITLHEFGIQL